MNALSFEVDSDDDVDDFDFGNCRCFLGFRFASSSVELSLDDDEL